MKHFKFIFLLCGILLLGQTSEAQVEDDQIIFETSLGIRIIDNIPRLSASLGGWITPRIVGHLWIRSQQKNVPFSWPNDLMIENGSLEELKMKTYRNIGLNFRVYQKPKNGFFAGFGITRQRYQIRAGSHFQCESGSGSCGGLVSIFGGGGITLYWKEISDKVWGINGQLGYAYRLKKGRFEFQVRQSQMFFKDRQYEYISERGRTETNTKSIRSDFDSSSLSFELSYVIDLF
jgi:hypothetical protein